MSNNNPTEACESCGLVAWINNGDCDDLCAFCKMRDENDQLRSQLEDTERHLAVARQERTGAYNAVHAYEEAEQTWKRDRERLEAETGRLRQALAQYGKHREHCTFHHRRDCDCGFDAVLQAVDTPP